MQITKAMPSGSWQVSDLIDGHLVQRQYYGYTKRSAVACFRKEFYGAVRYFVRVVADDGSLSVLSVKGRTEWTKRTAEKHAAEFQAAHGSATYLVEV